MLHTGTKYYDQTAWMKPLQPKLLMVLPSVGLISGEQFWNVMQSNNGLNYFVFLTIIFVSKFG
jgi:hypothetical protein